MQIYSEKARFHTFFTPQNDLYLHHSQTVKKIQVWKTAQKPRILH